MMYACAVCTLCSAFLIFGLFFGWVLNSLYMHMRSGFADYHECKIANVRKSAIVFGILLIVASLTFGCFTFGWMSYLQLKNQAFIDWDFACVMSGSELLGALIGSVFSRKMYEIEPTGFGPVPKPLLNIRRWQLF